MEAIEVAVFITVAVIIGSMMVAFIIDWNVKQTHDEIKGVIFKENEVGYKKLDSEQFVVELYNIWQDCGMGEKNSTVALYVQGTKLKTTTEEKISKEYIFKKIKMLNWCSSLQSVEYKCGNVEDIEMKHELMLPTVVSVSCNNHKLIIQ